MLRVGVVDWGARYKLAVTDCNGEAVIAGHLKRFGGLYLLVITYVSDYMNAPTPADGTVKGSTFDVIAAVSALLRLGSHLLPRLVPKSSPPSPKLGMTGTTRCSALLPSTNPHETPLSRLPSQPSPSLSPTRPLRACRAPPFRHARRHRSATA